MYESYVCSRVPAEAITIATFTYVSFMKYSAILTSAICEKKDFHGQYRVTWLNVGYKCNHSAD